VQQLSALGQFVGPPVVAALAAHAGGWQLTPLVTVGCCVVGAVLAWVVGRADERKHGLQNKPAS
jgi:hypothetical protein